MLEFSNNECFFTMILCIACHAKHTEWHKAGVWGAGWNKSRHTAANDWGDGRWRQRLGARRGEGAAPLFPTRVPGRHWPRLASFPIRTFTLEKDRFSLKCCSHRTTYLPLPHPTPPTQPAGCWGDSKSLLGRKFWSTPLQQSSFVGEVGETIFFLFFFYPSYPFNAVHNKICLRWTSACLCGGAASFVTKEAHFRENKFFFLSLSLSMHAQWRAASRECSSPAGLVMVPSGDLLCRCLWHSLHIAVLFFLNNGLCLTPNGGEGLTLPGKHFGLCWWPLACPSHTDEWNAHWLIN